MNSFSSGSLAPAINCFYLNNLYKSTYLLFGGSCLLKYVKSLIKWCGFPQSVLKNDTLVDKFVQ